MHVEIGYWCRLFGPSECWRVLVEFSLRTQRALATREGPRLSNFLDCLPLELLRS